MIVKYRAFPAGLALPQRRSTPQPLVHKFRC